MSNLNDCPVCGVSWLDGEIPEKSRHLYGGTHFKREIGIYDMDRDITVRWKCPDCKTEFDRFTMNELPDRVMP